MQPKPDNKNFSSEQRNAPVLTGSEVRGATPVRVSNWSFDAEIGLISVIAATVLAWIAGIGMRLKIKRDLGRKATGADLSSLDTWTKVDEVEQRNKPSDPSKPD